MRLFIFLFVIVFQFVASNVHAQNQNRAHHVLYKFSQTGDSLSLDVFLPDRIQTGDKFPVIMIFHGGAWVQGNRSLESIYYMQKLRASANQKGFAVVSIDYTLVNEAVHFPDPIIDCKDAIRWIRANAAFYNFDTDNIGLWGGSAGGHLALLAAYSDDTQWLGDTHLSTFSAKVNCVVDNFGPTDLNALLRTDASRFTVLTYKIFAKKLLSIREKLLYALSGTHFNEAKESVVDLFKEYSPVYYADSNAVPTLILHGTKDRIVPLRQSRELQKSLNSYQIDNELIVVKNGDHGFNNIPHNELDTLIEKTIDFYARFFRLSATHTPELKQACNK